MIKKEGKISEKSKQGKKNRKSGGLFETKVRQDLEGLGWIVSKWVNTVDFDKEGKIGKIVPAKRKYNPFSKVLTIGTGFPDFVCFKRKFEEDYEVIGLEVKSNGYLDQIEKSMCFWLLENKIFSRILIAKKSKKGNEMNRKSISPAIKLLEEGKGIEYIDFKEKYNKT